MDTSSSSSSLASSYTAVCAYRAGRIDVDATTKRATPCKDKGVIELVWCAEDELLHFLWRSRDTNAVGLDVIVFPDDASFVKQAERRVFVLEFKVPPTKYLFWAQEPAADNDDVFAAQVEALIQQPDAAADLVAAQQLQQPTSASATVTTPPPTTTPPPQSSSSSSAEGGAPGVRLEDLRSIMQLVQQHGGGAAPPDGPSMSAVLKPERLAALLAADPSYARELLPLLPEGQQSSDELASFVYSPQFAQTLEQFGEAIAQGQAPVILSQLGLPAEDAPPTQNAIEFFLRALVRGFPSSSSSSSSSSS